MGRVTTLVVNNLSADDQIRYRVINHGALVALTTARNEYATVAAANYKVVAAQYNAVATEFTDAAALVDFDALAELYVGAEPDKANAYLNASKFAERLDAAVSLLADAAALAGHEGTNTDGGKLALATDPSVKTTGNLWTAWAQSEGKIGKWGALLEAGATLHAAPLDGWEAATKAPRQVLTAAEVGLTTSRKSERLWK